MIALVCGWHDAHTAAITEMGNRLDAGELMVLAGHTLAEAYSVLTRLPAPHRLAPERAAELLQVNLLDQARRVVALDGHGYAELVRTGPTVNVSGGRVYDAVIAASASRAQVDALLTFNDRHFAGLLPDTIRIVVPQA